MRQMPTFVRDGDNAVDVPKISAAEWWSNLAEIAGRELTDDERRRADEMARHTCRQMPQLSPDWTLRVVASELFGDELVDRFYS